MNSNANQEVSADFSTDDKLSMQSIEQFLRSLYNEPSQANSEVLRERYSFPTRITNILLQWLVKHYKHPYPTSQDREQLLFNTGLTRKQLRIWLINARNRKLPKLRKFLAQGGRLARLNYDVNLKALTQITDNSNSKIFPEKNLTLDPTGKIELTLPNSFMKFVIPVSDVLTNEKWAII